MNLNKIALLRNSRRTGSPDLLHFAELAKRAGADGITVHPRPDERHITRGDVLRLGDWMRPWRPELELNIEGYPDALFLDLVRTVEPEQCTLVPDAIDAVTSDQGWQLDEAQAKVLRSSLPGLIRSSSRVFLFIDANPNLIPQIATLGISGVELYTGTFASAAASEEGEIAVQSLFDTARVARDHGLAVHIGHDLSLKNLPRLGRLLHLVSEASIGHELINDALASGFPEVIKNYRLALGCGPKLP